MDGEMNFFDELKSFSSPDNIAVIERISLEQLWEQEAINIFANCGSSGNSDMTEPFKD